MGKNPTDRGKKGCKRSLLVEASGGPLSIVVAAANVHDTKLLDQTLNNLVAKRPRMTRRRRQHLCLDKGYDNPTGHAAVRTNRYVPHIRHIGEEKLHRRKRGRAKPRRWVVERTHGWLSKCRAILVRYDKHSQNYRGLVELACALIWYRRLHAYSVLR